MARKFKLRPIARILAGREGCARSERGSQQARGQRGDGCRAEARSRGDLLPLGTMVTCIALAPAGAIAQPPAPTDTTLPEVKVQDTAGADDYSAPISTVGGGNVPTRVLDIPQTVNIINRAVMQAQGATSLQDALLYVPGVTLGAAEGGTIGNNINLRGFSARTDIYLDGMRDRGQYYRDVFALDAIEVLKGPSSMLFGRGSTGGIINQVSKFPSLTPYGEASVTVGTQPSLRGTADYNQPLSDTSAFRVSAMAQDVYSTRDVMKYKDFGIAPSLRFGIGTPTQVTLSGLFLYNDDMPDYGLPPVNGRPAGVDRKTFYGLTDDRTIQNVAQLGAIVSHDFSPQVTLRNQTSYFHYDIDARESGPNSVGTVTGGVYTPFPVANASNSTLLPLAALSVQLGSHDRQITDESLYNQTDLITRFETGPVRHTLLLGLELGWDSYRNQNFSRALPVVPLVAPPYLPAPPTAVSIPGNLVDASATDIAPYVNDTMELSDHWKVVAGLRYDRYKASITNTISPPPSADQTVGFTSVRAGVIYEPTNAQSYYVAYGTSFNPSLETLALTSGQQSLKPEESESFEIGAKWEVMNGNLLLTSALFQIEKQNARSQISPGVYQLTGDVRVRGFEAAAAGRITRNWQLIAGYTFLDAEIVKASALDGTQGKVPANTPQNSASLWTTYNFAPQWEAGTGMVYLSNRYANNTNTVSVGSYFRWDATVAYHQPKYDIRLNLLNLTNDLSFLQLIPSDRGRSVPGIARTALLTFTYKFF